MLPSRQPDSAGVARLHRGRGEDGTFNVHIYNVCRIFRLIYWGHGEIPIICYLAESDPALLRLEMGRKKLLTLIHGYPEKTESAT